MVRERSGQRWCPAYIGIGSNLESPVQQVNRALDALAVLPQSRLILRSSLYESAPVGPQEQPNFINAVAALLTTLDGRALLAELQAIEKEQGRVRTGERWGPRTLDLDLLVFGGMTIDEPGFTVPHPRIAERNFVLLPLTEIAPHIMIPGVGTVSSVALQCTSSTQRIKKL